MRQRAALVGYYPPKKHDANVADTRPVNIDRFEAIKANVAANPDAYQRYLNAIMSRLG